MKLTIKSEVFNIEAVTVLGSIMKFNYIGFNICVIAISKSSFELSFLDEVNSFYHEKIVERQFKFNSIHRALKYAVLCCNSTAVSVYEYDNDL